MFNLRDRSHPVPMVPAPQSGRIAGVRESGFVAMNWWDHSTLLDCRGPRPSRIAQGELHAMVSIALATPDELDELVIETDAGQLFCRQEIAYIGLLAGRPGLDHA